MITSPPPQPQAFTAEGRSRQLASLGYLVLAVGSAYYWYQSPWTDPLLKFLSILIGVLGVVPILRWLQRNDEAYPLIELLQLTMVPFYAIPLLNAHEVVARYPESILLPAAGIVVLVQILGQVGAFVADSNYRATPQSPWWTDDLVSDDTLRFSGYIFMATSVWLVITNFTPWVPSGLTGTLRAVFFGTGTISAFIQARLWGSNQLNQTQKLLFVFNIVAQFILMNLSLVLVTSMILLLLILIGYFSSARRLPLMVFLIALPTFALLHAGKHQMRDKHWGELGLAVEPSAVPAFYVEWMQYGVGTFFNLPGEDASPIKRSSLFERASLFQLVCYALDTVPGQTPYLQGESYSYVWPQIIPRFLWPSKPSPNDSVKLLSVKLGVLTEEQAETTSIGYGLITEAYVNYGVTGTGVLGFILGWVLRKVSRLTAQCGTLSGGGIFRILCLAWCLNAETTMAVWLSSFYQACIAIFGPLLLYSSFTKR